MTQMLINKYRKNTDYIISKNIGTVSISSILASNATTAPNIAVSKESKSIVPIVIHHEQSTTDQVKYLEVSKTLDLKIDGTIATTNPNIRFAGLDLEYYKSRIPPDQFQLLMKITGIFP
jgi:hypothetical protein